MRRALLVLVVAILAVGGGAYLLGVGRAGGTGTAPSATIPPVPLATTVTADATVVPVRGAELMAPTGGGRVVEVLATEGQRVAASAPLVRLDTRIAETDVRTAKATLAGTQATAARAEAAIREADQNVTAAQAGVDEARAAVTIADANRDAVPGGAPSSTKRAADAEVTRANAALRAARAQLSGARQAREVAVQTAAAAKADVDRATAAVDAAQADLDDRTIRAPFAGVVASLGAVVGETVGGTVPVARIADDGAWRFETTDLAEASLARVKLGATATITLDALPDSPIQAKVVRIGSFGEQSAGDVVYKVTLEPTGQVPDGLRWGMTASATIDSTN
jgi:multidrug resistance efflux pump